MTIQKVLNSGTKQYKVVEFLAIHGSRRGCDIAAELNMKVKSSSACLSTLKGLGIVKHDVALGLWTINECCEVKDDGVYMLMDGHDSTQDTIAKKVDPVYRPVPHGKLPHHITLIQQAIDLLQEAIESLDERDRELLNLLGRK